MLGTALGREVTGFVVTGFGAADLEVVALLVAPAPRPTMTTSSTSTTALLPERALDAVLAFLPLALDASGFVAGALLGPALLLAAGFAAPGFFLVPLVTVL
ncbi:MAG TPA: hypothetical protein PKE00_14490, partial [Planctomycetota bacterium]|nr:hypothetical protein [Planctomycetota bacterium]